MANTYYIETVGHHGVQCVTTGHQDPVEVIPGADAGTLIANNAAILYTALEDGLSGLEGPQGPAGLDGDMAYAAHAFGNPPTRAETIATLVTGPHSIVTTLNPAFSKPDYNVGAEVTCDFGLALTKQYYWNELNSMHPTPTAGYMWFNDPRNDATPQMGDIIYVNKSAFSDAACSVSVDATEDLAYQATGSLMTWVETFTDTTIQFNVSSATLNGNVYAFTIGTVIESPGINYLTGRPGYLLMDVGGKHSLTADTTLYLMRAKFSMYEGSDTGWLPSSTGRPVLFKTDGTQLYFPSRSGLSLITPTYQQVVVDVKHDDAGNMEVQYGWVATSGAYVGSMITEFNAFRPNFVIYHNENVNTIYWDVRIEITDIDNSTFTTSGHSVYVWDTTIQPAGFMYKTLMPNRAL